MEIPFSGFLKNAWNAFKSRDPTRRYPPINSGFGYSVRPDRIRLSFGNEQSIMATVLTRIAVDASNVDIMHCRVDEDGKYEETINSTLNNCLTLSANIDQTGRAFMQDVIMSMLDEGAIAIVPVDTDIDPTIEDSYKILTLRTAKIIEWRPRHVLLRVYNDQIGEKQEIWMPKESVAIVENPFYAIMNEPISTLKRLTRKMNLLDSVDEQTSSGKLDLLIQLPYTTKTPMQKKLAETRRKSIEEQLVGSKYGIAYIDGTERVIQLNRPAENNLLAQIEYYTNVLHNQLGLTENILNGTASEEEQMNYYNSTIVPILDEITLSMTRAFLTKTARSQGQAIMYFRDPFKSVPTTKLAEMGDKFRRNEITTSNEVRSMLGMRPNKDPRADDLRNPNLSQNNNEKTALLEDKSKKGEE